MHGRTTIKIVQPTVRSETVDLMENALLLATELRGFRKFGFWNSCSWIEGNGFGNT
jgi:hypothetical protein